MRRTNVIQAKRKQYADTLEDLAKSLPPDEYQRATMYQRGVLNALRWVLGELKDV